MKRLIRSVILWTAAICILPSAAARGAMEVTTAQVTEQPVLSFPEDMKIKILTEATGQVRALDIEEYAVYAVLEQIPFILSDEAMKSQVCIARTYAARQILSGEAENGAHISDNSALYQTALTENAARAVYGDEFEAAYSAVCKAAKATEGEIIMYDGCPASVPFHISSAGVTESAENVWGTPYPYLISVSSDESISEAVFTEAELFARLSAEYSEASLPVSPEILSQTQSGTVLSARLCGIELDGKRISELLSLDSRAFEISETDGKYAFTVKGTGHLAGMSICGAEQMAQGGSDYREILSHYYAGTEITAIE